MTIDEAIARFECIIEDWPADSAEPSYQALELGIEALKLLRANRNSAWPNKANILPGETEV